MSANSKALLLLLLALTAAGTQAQDSRALRAQTELAAKAASDPQEVVHATAFFKDGIGIPIDKVQPRLDNLELGMELTGLRHETGESRGGWRRDPAMPVEEMVQQYKTFLERRGGVPRITGFDLKGEAAKLKAFSEKEEDLMVELRPANYWGPAPLPSNDSERPR